MMYNFESVKALIDDFVTSVDVPGAEIMLAKDGKILYNYRAGYADREHKKPITDDTVYYLYSASKPITCAAVLKLVEEGRLSLDDKLSKYLPAFEKVTLDDGNGTVRPAENPILIRQLFTMTNGYTYEFLAKIGEMEGGTCETVKTLSHLASLPIRFEPDSSYAYGLGHDLLAAVAAVVTDMPYREYVKKAVFEPLGMTHSKMHVAENEKDDLAMLYFHHPDGKTTPIGKTNTFILGDEYDSGGAGIISCPGDYIKFAMTMTGRGTSPDGYPLLKPETVDRMRTPQLSETVKAAFNTNVASMPKGYSYGLGVRVNVDPANGWKSSVGEFGWDGAAGSFALFDPSTGISVFYAQHVQNWFGHTDHGKLVETVYDCFKN